MTRTHLTACPVSAVQEQVEDQRNQKHTSLGFPFAADGDGDDEVEDQSKQMHKSLDPLFPADSDGDDGSSSADTMMAGVPSAEDQAAGFEAVMSESSDLSQPIGNLGEFRSWLRGWGEDNLGSSEILDQSGENGNGEPESSQVGNGKTLVGQSAAMGPDVGGMSGGSVCGDGLFYDFVAQAVLHVGTSSSPGT